MREMKDSGVAWIGEIPETWSINKMKYIGTYINGYAFKPDDWGNTGLPIIRIQDLTGSNNNPNYFNGNIDQKYYVENGDILVSWAATLDAFEWNKGEGWLNQHIFKAIPQKDIVSKPYYIWLLKVAMSYMNDDNKHGIMMQHITLPVFNNFSIAIPPLEDQQKNRRPPRPQMHPDRRSHLQRTAADRKAESLQAERYHRDCHKGA